ncbi:MAG: helix-turn-helix domain-containing protein [Gammaproteobacteria bacterium]
MNGKDKAILWMDLTKSDGATLLPEIVGRQCRIHRVRNVEKLESEVRAIKPNLVCFEYDYPDGSGLAALTRIKLKFPALPILLITAYHSEALAVWALRARVWDYIVKPYSIEDILRTLTLLSEVCHWQERRKPRQVIAPINNALNVAPFSRLTWKEKAVLEAKTYIETHLDEKLQQTELARRYGMSHSHFSRAFRQLCGVGFSEFVLRARIEKALHVLADPQAQITTACYEVGFRDLSYFGRIFRRYVGMSPTEYQNTQRQADVDAAGEANKNKFVTASAETEFGADRQSLSPFRMKVFKSSLRQLPDIRLRA